jgi:hypothetical protein
MIKVTVNQVQQYVHVLSKIRDDGDLFDGGFKSGRICDVHRGLGQAIPLADSPVERMSRGGRHYLSEEFGRQQSYLVDLA